MGCTNQKSHTQQIAYQRDFLGACWNSSLGVEEAEEYLASRWMGVSKNVMALYTNHHCFTVRTLKKDEKARADVSAAGKPAMKAADAPAGLPLGFGDDRGGGEGGGSSGSMQPHSPSFNLADSPSLSTVGKPLSHHSKTVSASAPLLDGKQSRNLVVSPLGCISPPPLLQPAIPNRPVTIVPPTTTVTAAAHTTVRQTQGHAHGVNNNSVDSAKDDHGGGASNSASPLSGLGRPPPAEKVKKSTDPTALRNVMKDSIESERIVHADHPYLQRHGLSVYDGVVFRCAPVRRLYHRISLVPEANMKRLYGMQLTAMSRSVMSCASTSMIGRPEMGGGQSEAYQHFRPFASSSDEPYAMRSSDADERRATPMTQHLPPSMVPSPMSRPLKKFPGPAVDASTNYAGPPLLDSSLDPSLPLPSLPLGAVPARHLRFASGPEVQQSAVIDAWAAENPLSTFNNYPIEDHDVAGVMASRPPVIIGSVTAMELQALPPNAEICFGGWLYVSLQDEQERLRKSLKRYAARQRRRAAKEAAEDAVRFSAAFSSLPSSSSKRRSTQRPHGCRLSTPGVNETDIEVEICAVNLNDSANTKRPLLTLASAVQKKTDSGEERMPQSEKLMLHASYTAVFKESESPPLPQLTDSSCNDDNEDGETVRKKRSDDVRKHDAVLAEESPSATSARSKELKDSDNGNEKPEPNVKNHNSGTAVASTKAASPARMQTEPVDTPVRLRTTRSATISSLRTPPRTPPQQRPRSASMPPSPMMGPSIINIANNPPVSPPWHHAGRYAREAMEADTLNAAWLPYAYIVVAIPMYECSLVPTTFHTAFTRHKAVSLNLNNAQSRQAYGVGCITGVRYGGVMVIEYREKVNDEEDAEWIAELIRVGKMAQNGDSSGGDAESELNNSGNFGPSPSTLFRRTHHTASHRARAEKLRRIKSRIWHKLRRQGLHVVLAATRMADRRHRQQRASIANEVSKIFSGSHVDPAAATPGMGSSYHTPQQRLSASVRRPTAILPQLPLSVASARRGSPGTSRSTAMEPVRVENKGMEEDSVSADHGAGGAEELSEAMEDAVDGFDSTNRSVSTDSDSDSNGFSRPSRSSSDGHDGAGTDTCSGTGSGGCGEGTARSWGQSRNKKKRQWWRLSSSRRRHRRRRGSAHSGGGENDHATGAGGCDTKGFPRRHHHHHGNGHHGVTTREDRLRWADPQMGDDFYIRGTFRQIGGIKYLDVISLMDGCPVSELVQGIKRWVLNLLSMPVKARPICLFLQRYEGVATSLRITQTQLTATAHAYNIAAGKQLVQGNFSFHMPSGGMTGEMGNNMSIDEVSASFASQHLGDPSVEPMVSSPSALVNAPLAALQATVPPPTRALAYQTYYCGPLEPEVRAVLSPEMEAMITSCQTRLLPDVLKSSNLRTPAAAAAEEEHSNVIAAGPLSPPLRELGSDKCSTVTGTATHRATGQDSTANTMASPVLSVLPPPPTDAAGSTVSNHFPGPLSPSLEQAHPGFGMPHLVDVSSQLSHQQSRQQPQLSVPQPQQPTSSVPQSLSLPPSIAHTNQAKTLTHPQLQPASPHRNLAARSTSTDATGIIETDAAVAPLRLPANTVPKTITEFLLYDDPTKEDSNIGRGTTAANSQALTAAAAAALVLQENVKGPAALSNASLVAPSNTCSFPTIYTPTKDSKFEMPREMNVSSFDHVRDLRESTVTVMAAHADKEAAGAHARSAAQSKEPQESKEAPPQSPPTDKKHKGKEIRENSSNSSDDDDFNDHEVEERELEWQLADRELRALKSELAEMMHHISVARSELLERLEEFIQLGTIFLPHTQPDQVGLSLVVIKMLRQYPEEVPVKEIHTDWVPLLTSLLTSSRANLFCSSGYDGGDLGRMVGNAQEFLTTYNNIVDVSDMHDANMRRQACDSGVTKYMIEPLPPMPAPRRLHDIVIAPQPVRFTPAMLHGMERVGMDSEGLSFAFSGGSLGVLAGIFYYYSDFLRAKYRSEVAAVGGRAKDAGATVLDVLSRGGYNVLLRRIWIWGVTPEPKKSKSQTAVAATKTLLQKKLTCGNEANTGNATPKTSCTGDEHNDVTTNKINVGGVSTMQVVGRPFRGTEAYALYDAIVHYLRTLEELCIEHHGSNSIAPQVLVKRRSVLLAWRRSKDGDTLNADARVGATATNGRLAAGDTQNGGQGSFPDDLPGTRDLVANFEVCVATNYYYKRVLSEANRPVPSHTADSSGGGGATGSTRYTNSAHTRNNETATRHSSTADVAGRLGLRRSEHDTQDEQRQRSQAFSAKKVRESLTKMKPVSTKDKIGSSSTSSHEDPSAMEKPYCGGEERMKKDSLQRKAAKKFYDFLTDHLEQWRARYNEDRTTNAYGKRISISMN